VKPVLCNTFTLPTFALLHAANSFSCDESSWSGGFLSRLHHASITPATASVAKPLPQKSGWILYPTDGAGERALIPAPPMTFCDGSSERVIAKKNLRSRAPDASGVVNVFWAIMASVSEISLWATLGYL